jgi:tRNA threonylcarbamoyladenosine biosynthesis protein TsaB
MGLPRVCARWKRRQSALAGPMSAAFGEQAMSSFAQILAAHGPAVVIDAASSLIQVGWCSSADSSWETSTEEAGTAIFSAIQALGVDPTAAGSFVFCDGPGSILGIRSAAMAIRTWCVLKPRPVFAYCSLALVAESPAAKGLSIIADARRDMWHRFQSGGQLQRVPAAALNGPLATPENFRHWSSLPAHTSTLPYRLPDLLTEAATSDIMRPTTAPDAFLHEEPSYVTWTPQIHRGPRAV